MKSTSVVLAALVAGLLPVFAAAQAAPATAAPAPAAAPASEPPAQPKMPPPSAFPARIALVNFVGAVSSTNEGQRTQMEVEKKYEPTKEKLQTEAAELDSMKKKLQAAPATITDEERARLTREIDSKDKHLQSESEDAGNSYNADMNDALQKVAAKVHEFMIGYVQKNGYTLLLNYGDQQSPLIWATQDQNADITEAIIEEYNKTSGVAAPAPSAPSAPAATHRPAGTTGATHSTTAPHTTTPTKPAQ